MNTNLMVKGQGSRVKGQGKTQNSKLKTIFLLLTVHLSLFTVTGCQQKAAQVMPDDKSALQNKQEIEKQQVSIDAIKFYKADDAAKVFIHGTGQITYTAFKLSEPYKIVIDIPDANMDRVKEPIAVDNDHFVKEIRTFRYGKEQAGTNIGRIEIELRSDVDYRIELLDDKLQVSLISLAPKEVAKTDNEKKPDVVSQKEDARIDAKELPVRITSTAKKAERIISIETVKREKELTQIIVSADGDIGSYNAFGLDDPSRLVVDVWGVGTGLREREVDVGGSHIKKIRIGEHRDKIRLVFESLPKNFPLYSIDVNGSQMIVSYGKVEAKKQEVAAVSQKSENRVNNIDFKPSASSAKLTINTSKKSDYKLSKSLDGKNIVIDLKDVVMPDEFKKTMDVFALDTPVESISSFQMAGRNDARILVKLKEGSAYNVSRDSNSIYLNFPMQAKGLPTLETPQEKAQESVQSARIESAVNIPANAALNAAIGEEKLEKKAESSLAVDATVSGETPIDCKAKMPTPTYLCKKLSLDFKDADIGNILRLMAEVSGLNIITDEGVTGKVTLRLIDVPWHQAFDIILKSKGLGKLQEGNVVRIATMTKIKQEEDAALAAKKAKEKLEDMVTEMVSISYAKAEDMGKKLKSALSDRGSVIVDERTNTLIIKDIPANLKSAVALVKSLDTQTPQVLIEARIVEAGNNFGRDLGIQWGVDYRTNTGVGTTDVFGSMQKQFGQSPHDPNTQTAAVEGGGVYPTEKKKWPARAGVTNYAVNLPAASANAALGIVFGKLGGSPTLLDLRLTAGEQAGTTKIISRPRIATLDNKEAKIQQGESIPFETTSATGKQTTFIDANLSLTVTPHITADGSIIMTIKVNNNEIGSFRSASGAPSINKKEAITEILVKDGETAVIGGIVKNTKSDSVSGIPLFKDIPLLGWLFKTKSVKDIQSELLIFITPTILKEKLAENVAN